MKGGGLRGCAVGETSTKLATLVPLICDNPRHYINRL